MNFPVCCITPCHARHLVCIEIRDFGSFCGRVKLMIWSMFWKSSQNFARNAGVLAARTKMREIHIYFTFALQVRTYLVKPYLGLVKRSLGCPNQRFNGGYFGPKGEFSVGFGFRGFGTSDPNCHLERGVINKFVLNPYKSRRFLPFTIYKELDENNNFLGVVED